MLKTKRARYGLIAVIAVVALAAVYLFYTGFVVPGNSVAVGTGQPQAPTLALRSRSSTTPAAAVYDDPRLVSNIDRALPRPAAQVTFYTSCTEERRVTPTPTSVAPAAATSAATAAATLSATMAATTAPAVAASDLIVFNISGQESEACYQVGEVFINRNNQFGLAVGVSNAVSGQIAIDKANVANSQVGQIVVDISQLKSDTSQRDGQIRSRWLESNKFPLAKFTPTTITGLPEGAYTEGQTLNFTMTGDMLIRDTTKTVTFTVKATLKDNVLAGSATTDIKMTDFGFDPPEIGGLLKANNEARLVLNFVARPAQK